MKKQLIIACACEIALLVELQNGTIVLENCLAVSYKAKRIPYDPAIPPPGIYPREMKTCAHTEKLYMNIRALFIIAPTWKQPRFLQ